MLAFSRKADRKSRTLLSLLVVAAFCHIIIADVRAATRQVCPSDRDLTLDKYAQIAAQAAEAHDWQDAVLKRVPKDLKVTRRSQRYFVTENVEPRILPLQNAPGLAGHLRWGSVIKAPCQILGPDGMMWAIQILKDGVLNYVPGSALKAIK